MKEAIWNAIFFVTGAVGTLAVLSVWAIYTPSGTVGPSGHIMQHSWYCINVD